MNKENRLWGERGNVKSEKAKPGLYDQEDEE
jgi:hypothetical protein